MFLHEILHIPPHIPPHPHTQIPSYSRGLCAQMSHQPAPYARFKMRPTDIRTGDFLVRRRLAGQVHSLPVRRLLLED